MRERIYLEDGTSFPIVENDDELIWRAFHVKEISDYDKKRLGGIAQAYMSLVSMPLTYSREKLSMIKKVMRTQGVVTSEETEHTRC
jgi:hypothetical protein